MTGLENWTNFVYSPTSPVPWVSLLAQGASRSNPFRSIGSGESSLFGHNWLASFVGSSEVIFYLPKSVWALACTLPQKERYVPPSFLRPFFTHTSIFGDQTTCWAILEEEVLSSTGSRLVAIIEWPLSVGYSLHSTQRNLVDTVEERAWWRRHLLVAATNLDIVIVLL